MAGFEPELEVDHGFTGRLHDETSGLIEYRQLWMRPAMAKKKATTSKTTKKAARKKSSGKKSSAKKSSRKNSGEAGGSARSGKAAKPKRGGSQGGSISLVVPAGWWECEAIGTFEWTEESRAWAWELLERCSIEWPWRASQAGRPPPMFPGAIVGSGVGHPTGGGSVLNFDESSGFLGVALDHPLAQRSKDDLFFVPHIRNDIVEDFKRPEVARLWAVARALGIVLNALHRDAGDPRSGLTPPEREVLGHVPIGVGSRNAAVWVTSREIWTDTTKMPPLTWAAQAAGLAVTLRYRCRAALRAIGHSQQTPALRCFADLTSHPLAWGDRERDRLVDLAGELREHEEALANALGEQFDLSRLTDLERRVFAQIGPDPISQREIARRIGRSPASVGNAVVNIRLKFSPDVIKTAKPGGYYRGSAVD